MTKNLIFRNTATPQHRNTKDTLCRIVLPLGFFLFFSAQCWPQCQMPNNGGVQPSFFNIVILMDQGFVNTYGGGNVSAARTFAEQKAEAGIAALNAVFTPYALSFSLIFHPNYVSTVSSGSGGWSSWRQAIKSDFANRYPCVSYDGILYFYSGSGGGHADEGLAFIGGGAACPQLIMHEVGHLLGLPHTPASDCVSSPGFMCADAECTDLSFSSGDNPSALFTPTNCTKWRHFQPKLSPDYTCPEEPRFGMTCNQTNIVKDCVPDRTLCTYTLTATGSNTRSYFKVRVEYLTSIFDFDMPSMGMDFNSDKPTSTSGRRVLSIREPNSPNNEVVFVLEPNEKKTFHFQLRYNGGNVTFPTTFGEFVWGWTSNPYWSTPRPFNHQIFKNLSGTVNAFDYGAAYMVSDITISEPITGQVALGASELLFTPGGSITIASNNTLSFFPGLFTKISGCDGMWKGITVNASSALNMENATLKDAQNAVLVKRGGEARIVNNTFDENNIGVFVEASTGANTPKTDALIVGNTFKCSQGFLDASYSGQSPAPNGRSYCGVVTNDIPINLTGNSFKDLKNGVFAFNSRGSISGNLFMNMYEESPGPGYVGGGSAKGMAIDARNTTLTADDNRIFGAKAGIKLNLGSLDAKENTIEMVKVGIDALPTSNSRLNLNRNTVKARDWGIKTFQPASLPNQFTVGSNRVTMNDNEKGIGISTGSSGDLLSQTGGQFTANQITMTNGATALLIGAANKLTATGNVITLSNVASNLHGIKIEGGDRNTFDVNHVAGVGGKSDGILATHPSRSNFWCNGAYRTKNGLHFEGMLSGRRAADVAGNSMTQNETGMLLGASAVIGRQEHRGNIWGGGFTGIGANCLGDPTNSPFIVDAAENPQFMPPTFSPANWFLDNNNNNTNSSYLCASLVNPNGPGTGLDEDLSIVHGTIGGEQHTALNNWIARNRLYERLTEEGNPHTGNQEIAAFLNGAQSNGIAAFSAVRAGIRQAFVISQADQTALVEAEDQLQEGFSALGQVEAALTATGLAHQDSLGLVDARSEIQGSIELVSGQKVTILHNHLLQRLPTINALITQNNNLIAFDPWEQHEKTVNDIFLHTIGLGSFEFTATQLNALGGIAGLCPLSDGEAVLRARALLAITDEVPTVYDDAIICQPAEERNYAQTGEAQPIMRVYPNPASDAVTIDYRLSKYSEHRLLLYNVFGKVVFETSLSEQQGRLTLPLQVLPPGIYWCQIPTAGSQKTISKLVISR